MQTLVVQANRTTATQESCGPGTWCAGGAQFLCEQGYYNPTYEASSQSSCIMCPLRSTTLRQGATSIEECICIPGYYNNLTYGVCIPCPVGTLCPDAGVTLLTLPLKKGYYRASALSTDVRKCADAATNCSSATTTVCEYTSSGCRGGSNFDTYCAPGLSGRFCMLCNNDTDVFYERASDHEVASCKPCANRLTTTVIVASGCIVGMLVLLYVSQYLWRRMPRHVRSWIWRQWHTYALYNKFKIALGFYQIATKVSKMYEVTLPADARRFLESVDLSITFGFNVGTPLQCLGLHTYATRLLFWIVAPIALVVLIYVFYWLLALSKMGRRRRLSGSALRRLQRTVNSAVLTSRRICTAAAVDAMFTSLRRGTPVALKILFMAYPVVTSVAFESFLYYDLGDDGQWLMADVSVRTGTDEHDAVLQRA